MENSPFPDKEKIYEYVYAQEDYPFLDKVENNSYLQIKTKVQETFTLGFSMFKKEIKKLWQK